MLAYFPTIYPGELLYSVLARYHRHVGGTSPSRTNETLFGARHVIASLDLPGFLDTLAARIPPMRGLTVETLIDRTTLYPYYTAFEPAAVRARVRRAMRAGNAEGLHLALGIAAFRAGRVTRLRFCHECQLEMLARYGELSWRRDQQLPGVLVCPEHGTPLLESRVSVTRGSRHAYIAARPGNCPRQSRPLIGGFDDLALDRLRAVARRSAALLKESVEARTFAGWSACYRDRMVRAGLARSPAKMDQRTLERAFRAYYGGALAALPEILDEGRFTGDWLAKMVQKHRHAVHPLHHVLLEDFLAAQEEVPKPFGSGPWPCLNPLARHRSRPVVTDLREHRESGRIVGVFSCACGYVYARSYDPRTRTLGRTRFRSYGPLFAPELSRSLAAGISLRQIATRLALDPKTVVSLARELGMPVPWSLKPSRKPRTDSRATSRARKRPATARASKKRSSDEKARSDWSKIDAAWVARLEAAATEIRKTSPPVRVSLAELERRIGTRGWIGKRRAKLPLTIARIAKLTETIEDFQQRRIFYCIEALQETGEPLQPWLVMRKAGLRSNSLGRIREALDAKADRWESAA